MPFFLDSGITDADAVELARALRTYHNVRNLLLAGNKIGDPGAEAIAAVLKEDSTLSSVDLCWNQIGVPGAKALASALKQNTHVKGVFLDFNNIGDQGAKLLARVLTTNRTITVLRLAHNEIGTDGVTAVASALKQNTTIKIVSLQANHIGDAGAISIADLLLHNRIISHVNILMNGIEIAGEVAIANTLKENKVVTIRVNVEKYARDFEDCVEVIEENDSDLQIVRSLSSSKRKSKDNIRDAVNNNNQQDDDDDEKFTLNDGSSDVVAEIEAAWRFDDDDNEDKWLVLWSDELKVSTIQSHDESANVNKNVARVGDYGQVMDDVLRAQYPWNTAEQGVQVIKRHRNSKWQNLWSLSYNELWGRQGGLMTREEYELKRDVFFNTLICAVWSLDDGRFLIHMHDPKDTEEPISFNRLSVGFIQMSPDKRFTSAFLAEKAPKRGVYPWNSGEEAIATIAKYANDPTMSVENLMRTNAKRVKKT